MMIEDWLRNKEKEFENWNLESGLQDTIQRQLKRANVSWLCDVDGKIYDRE